MDTSYVSSTRRVEHKKNREERAKRERASRERKRRERRTEGVRREAARGVPRIKMDPNRGKRAAGIRREKGRGGVPRVKMVPQRRAGADIDIDEHGQILPWFRTRMEVRADVPVDASRHVHPQFARSRAGFQPVYGHVSLVKPGEDATAEHFMFGLDKEIDDNQMLLVQQSRKGPFKNEIGRSRILHSTANTVYRRRGSNMEITITRKATLPEIQVLIAKLNAHSMTNGSTSFLMLLLRGKTYRMGALSGVNLDLLKKQILEGIQKHGSAGLVVTDVRSGPLTEYQVHSYNFASKVLRDKSMFAV